MIQCNQQTEVISIVKAFEERQGSLKDVGEYLRFYFKPYMTLCRLDLARRIQHTLSAYDVENPQENDKKQLDQRFYTSTHFSKVIRMVRM